MPTYEYKCECCGNEHEEVQSITAPAREQCPKCHLPTLKRLVSGGTHFILKGKGWAADLYSRPAPKATT